jgi:hypothetical protein
MLETLMAELHTRCTARRVPGTGTMIDTYKTDHLTGSLFRRLHDATPINRLSVRNRTDVNQKLDQK